jgi:ADP-ribose pyrophosphatase YjhB (NUDIX family)
MKFCPACSGTIEQRIPEGDHRLRAVCLACGTIHYQNPRIVAGCVVECQNQILLCRRAIEPRLGLWTNPAGFMEIGETVQAAAARETREEALAEVQLGSMLAVVNVLRSAQVHIFFRARLPEPRFGAGAESLEVRLYDEAQIPWDDMAFTSSVFALKRYLADRRNGVAELHFLDLA